jgi:hypothetical protein
MSLNGLRYGGQMPSKPLPDWLFYPLFWLIVPPAIVAMMVSTMLQRTPQESRND